MRIAILVLFMFHIREAAKQITAGETCSEDSGCNCVVPIKSKTGDSTYDASGWCTKNQKCSTFQGMFEMMVRCESNIVNNEVCLAEKCNCLKDHAQRELNFLIFCVKGETCYGGAHGTAQSCTTYIKPNDVCGAVHSCVCKDGDQTGRISRGDKCKSSSFGPVAEKSQILPLGVECVNAAGCVCDSRKERAVNEDLGGTSLKIKSGQTCFAGKTKTPEARKTIRSGTIPDADNLWCISDKFDPRNTQTFLSCKKSEMCMDYKGRAYCAKIFVETLGNYKTYMELQLGYMVAVKRRQGDQYITQFCLPYEEMSLNNEKLSCKQMTRQPEIPSGEVCYHKKEGCFCGAKKAQVICFMGEKCTVDGQNKGSCQSESNIKPFECSSVGDCSCWKMDRSAPINPSAAILAYRHIFTSNKWTENTPICDVSASIPTFTSRSTNYTTRSEIEDALLQQILDKKVTFPARRSRQLRSFTAVSAKIKI